MHVVFREAKEADLEHVVAMLADDDLGVQREDASLPVYSGYRQAFQAVDEDPNNSLIVVEQGVQIVGMLQLTYIPYMTFKGSWRCLIESVRARADCRGQGLGEEMFSWAIEQAKSRACHMVQLTSDKQRPGALRFYQKLGFVASHEGFKLRL